METTHFVNRGDYGILDLFGPTAEFLTPPDAPYCMMIGVIPPGVSIPLHSHADVESFYVLAGSVQVYSQRGDTFEWLEAETGQFVHVPGNAKHAFQNTSGEPVVQMITTTPKMARFFQEIGRPATAGMRLPPPEPGDLERFARIAAEYGYWNAAPEENAAIGLPSFG